MLFISVGNCPVTVLSMQMELVSVTLGHDEVNANILMQKIPTLTGIVDTN